MVKKMINSGPKCDFQESSQGSRVCSIHYRKQPQKRGNQTEEDCSRQGNDLSKHLYLDPTEFVTMTGSWERG